MCFRAVGGICTHRSPPMPASKLPSEGRAEGVILEHCCAQAREERGTSPLRCAPNARNSSKPRLQLHDESSRARERDVSESTIYPNWCFTSARCSSFAAIVVIGKTSITTIPLDGYSLVRYWGHAGKTQSGLRHRVQSMRADAPLNSAIATGSPFVTRFRGGQ